MKEQSPLSDAELQMLVLRAQDGDTASFERLYKHFFTPIYRYTAFRAPSEMAEDIVADVFVRAWEKLHQYKVHKGIPFGAWLSRIARHAVIDVYRQERHFDEVPEEYADPDQMNRADADLHRRDVVRIVREALEQLPRRYREVLVLSYIAELGHEEVARVLHLTAGAVRILKFRALRKLEALLPPDVQQSSPQIA